MKKFLSILLTLVMLFSVAAFAESEEPLKVGFTLPSMTFPFYVRMYEQFMAEAEQRGWEVTFVDGNLDAGNQMNGCQDLINSGVDVMVIATWYIDALADIYMQCKEKGIGVFEMDNFALPEATADCFTFSTGTDNYNAGVVGGTWCAEYLKKQGKESVNVILVSAQSEQQIKRCSGFTDALEQNGITVNVLNTYNGSVRETAMQVCENALTAYPELDLIYGGSAQDALGGYDATVGAGRTEVMVVGFDGEDEEIEKVDAGTNYIATITQDPAGQSTNVALHIDKWLAGESFDQMLETPAGVYCAEGQLTGAEIMG